MLEHLSDMSQEKKGGAGYYDSESREPGQQVLGRAVLFTASHDLWKM